MKIALAHKKWQLKGGTERVFYQTALGMRDRGHDVHLFCQKFSMAIPEGVTAHRVPGLSWPRTARLLTFGVLAPAYIARFHCDVLLSFDRLIKQDLFRSGGGPHKTYLAKMLEHGGWLKPLWYSLSPYHRLALAIERRQVSPQGCWKIIAVCEQGRREMVQAYDLAEGRLEVIHNGVDHERFHPSRRHACGATLRAALAIPRSARVVLFVGTGFRRKGLARLLRVWRQDPPPNCYLLVVGNDARLASYRRAWRGHPQVIFAGPRSNIEDYYAAADVLALPSVQEAFGNVVLEALASGLPIITVPGVGALDKAGEELREGILTDPDDCAELRARIARLSNPLRWPALSRQARAVAEKYTWAAYLDRVEALFDEFVRLESASASPLFQVLPPVSAAQKMP